MSTTASSSRCNVTAQGYNRLSVPVTLHEKGKDKILDKKTVIV